MILLGVRLSWRRIMSNTLPAVSTTPPRATSLALKRYFRKIKAPRRAHRRWHSLIDLLVIAICAVLCGANTWPEVATWAQRRATWLRRFLALPHGIPSHDTFERVFDRIDPLAFQACFRAWITTACETLQLPHVAIDGKTLRRSGDGRLGPLHVVSAWATRNHLALGEVAVAEKSNEITAIPRLLDLLDLNGALVTIDAMGCQKEIAKKVRERGADYVLTVKDNQPHLLQDIQMCLQEAFEREETEPRLDHWETQGKAHGRTETRSYTVLRNPVGIRGQEAWKDLCVVGMCTSVRTTSKESSVEVRYFIGSRDGGARVYGEALRGHWGIENGLHWHMDINFGEDASRIRHRGGAENFAVVRRIALSLLRQHPAKLSIACKRLAAACDTDFLEEILKLAGNSEKP
jgi:predicted transposase YbfD/YdcC